MIRAIRAGIETLHPAYFALVMATGIVAIANHVAGSQLLAHALTWINLTAYAALWLLTLARIARHRARFLSDVADHNRGVGFFTMVAGTNVLGSQLVLIFGAERSAEFLLLVGAALWILLTYTIFTAFTIKDIKPTLDKGINGGWLLAVVATQSVASLSTTLSPAFEGREEAVLVFALCCWLVGGMLYLWLISLIFYRYTFFRLAPQDLMPPYWINMGAMAISTLAGAGLILRAGSSDFLQSLLPFIKGLTLLCWATATWWIPMLVVLGFWRHVYKRFALIYDPLYWGMVFPLGMYAACTWRLGQAFEFPALMGFAEYFVYIADAAWLATFTGMVVALVGLLRTRDAADPAGA